jgi:hypothetical protein
MNNDVNPFESPREAKLLPPTDLAAEGRCLSEYRSARGCAKAATVFLIVVLVTKFLVAGYQFRILQMLDDVQHGTTPTSSAVQGALIRHLSVSVCDIVAYIASGISFIVWFFRVHRNLPSLGNEGLKWSPGWTIGAWFIPLANWILPYLVMCEVWNGSNPANIDNKRRQNTRVSAWVTFWWAAFVSMSCLNATVFVTSLGYSVAFTVYGGQILLGGSCLAVVGDLLAIVVMWFVVENQEERFKLSWQRAVEAMPMNVELLISEDEVA